MKYVIYARKSSESEDRQVLSIEAQLAELYEFAAKEKLEITASYTEAKTAKEPGRTEFAKMIERIENDKIDGIIAWHPDRLARNSIDGGKIIYLVDSGKIKSLKFPTFWFNSTPQGKFMLNIAFGQSKYYVDNLSENVKRGIRQKLRRGEWPAKAQPGYLNDLRSHTIYPDPDKAPLVKRIFELYADGDHNLCYLSNLAGKMGMLTKTEKFYTPSMIQYMLQNPIYCGVIKWRGELYEGTHEPIITKKLFDKAQEVMKLRGKKRKKESHNFSFTGLMNCSCGCAITAETQKGHTYYRCTKKKGPCNEKYTREELLVAQFNEILQTVSFDDDKTAWMLNKCEEEQKQAVLSSQGLVQNIQEKIHTIKKKLNNLLDSRLEDIISKDEYTEKKNNLLNQKLNLEAEKREILDKGNNWLEPMRDFILDRNKAKKIADKGNLMEIRSIIKKIGSNFILKGKKVEWLAKNGWQMAREARRFSTWQARPDSNREPRFWRPMFYR